MGIARLESVPVRVPRFRLEKGRFSVVSTSVNNSTTYTVPAGKKLIILAVMLSSGSGSGEMLFLANSITILPLYKSTTTSTTVNYYSRMRYYQSSNANGISLIAGSPNATAEALAPTGSSSFAFVDRDFIAEVDEGMVVKTSTSSLTAVFFGYLVQK